MTTTGRVALPVARPVVVSVCRALYSSTTSASAVSS